MLFDYYNIYLKILDVDNLKKILLNNPRLLVSQMQRLYDNIIVYFTNRNYKFEENVTSEENYIVDKICLGFSIVFNNSSGKENFHKQVKDAQVTNESQNRNVCRGLDDNNAEKIFNFQVFSNMLKNLFAFFINLENMIDLNTLQSESYFIKYKVDYAGIYKEVKNNVIIALAYSAYQKYKNFKENIYIEESDDCYKIYADAINRYITAVEYFREKFSLIENFKFYEESELKLKSFLSQHWEDNGILESPNKGQISSEMENIPNGNIRLKLSMLFYLLKFNIVFIFFH